MTGSIVAQALPVAISPILTRLYSPEDFGIFALYMSCATIISVIATGRYELAIMLPSNDIDAINLTMLSAIISLFISILSLIILYFFHEQILTLLGNKEISQWLYIVPITVFLTGLYQSMNYWMNRKKHYANLSSSRIVKGSTSSAASIAFGFSGFRKQGLIMGEIISLFASVFFIGILFCKKYKSFFRHISKKKIKQQAIQYKSFPKFDILNALLFSLSKNGVIILLTRFYGGGAVGFYSFTQKILITPFHFFTNSFSQVFYQKLADNYNKNQTNFSKLLNKAIDKMVIFITIPLLLFVILSKYFIPFIFGENWKDLYQYVCILSPFIYLNLIVVPVSFVLKVISKQKLSLILNFFLFLAQTVTIAVSSHILNYDILTTLFLFSIISFFVLFINTLIILRVAKARQISNLFLLSFLLIILYYLALIKVHYYG